MLAADLTVGRQEQKKRINSVFWSLGLANILMMLSSRCGKMILQSPKLRNLSDTYY
jgi:hypothetical protein